MSSSGSTSDHFSECESEHDDSLANLQAHFELLSCDGNFEERSTFGAVPIFTNDVRKHGSSSEKSSSTSQVSQYGLLGANVSDTTSTPSLKTGDSRIFYNTAAPTSMFICRSQGSGKSHTLSTLLENCLIPCKANQLPRPLTGLVFHYDTFISDTGGNACEAAYLASHNSVKVRVLCAPTNIGQIKRIYQKLPNVSFEELRINQSDLNTKRMLDLMAVSSIQGSGMPLYLHVVSRILRDLRILQQKSDTPFDYGAFKVALKNECLTEGQSVPLNQRLETLESFMVQQQAMVHSFSTTSKTGDRREGTRSFQKGNSWNAVAGQLTIVDLSCPCVTADMACSLFNICLSLFLEQDTKVGRVVALDEAHRYMDESVESQTLTESLLSTIRLQRYLGTRVIISTQKPTINPKLLDLCSVTIVHRFTSPDWLKALERHLAGVSALPCPENTFTAGLSASLEDQNIAPHIHVKSRESLFVRIVALRTGEAFVFAPSALIGVKTPPAQPQGGSDTQLEFIQLGNSALKIRIRKRVTAGGGKSIMAHLLGVL